MTCKEAESLVQDYALDQINSNKKMEAFIEHVQHCPSCYDELETYFIIRFATKYLDDEKHQSYDMKKMLHEDMTKKMARVRRNRRHKVIFSSIVLISQLCLLTNLLLFLDEINSFEWFATLRHLFGI